MHTRLKQSKPHSQPQEPMTSFVHGRRRRLGIVSNNRAASVEIYLNMHDLEICVDNVSARVSADVALLKPSPHLVIRACRALEARLSRCALIGDSRTDIEAAIAADVAVIGFANKPGKVDNLSGFRANRPDP